MCGCINEKQEVGSGRRQAASCKSITSTILVGTHLKESAADRCTLFAARCSLFAMRRSNTQLLIKLFLGIGSGKLQASGRLQAQF
jgi:hypothetical protein